jgi:hypothetical protein
MKKGETPKPGLSDPVKVSLIGASATILVALISGIFTLLNRTPAAPAPIATPTISVVEPATNTEMAATATLAPPPTATAVEPAVVATAVTEMGFAFASQIAADGMALDPGTTFAPTVKEIYAVFQVGRTPPGVNISHPNPTAGAYYAFLERADTASPAKIGWQWFLNEDLLNEYETSLHSGYLWLSLYAQGERGLFEGSFGPPAPYDVRITLDGNPALRAQLVISPTLESTDP